MYRDTQPIRCVAFDPTPTPNPPTHTPGETLFALGTNSRALILARAPTQAGGGPGSVSTVLDRERGLPLFQVERTLNNHHLGSVYAVAWGPPPPPGDGYYNAHHRRTIATASNDTTLKVSCLQQQQQGGGGGGGGAGGSVGGSWGGSHPPSVLNAGVATIRDVCFWAGGIAAAGGGDFSIKVYDYPIKQEGGGHTSPPPPPPPPRILASLQGHASTVHALRPWSLEDPRHLLSASADGTVALWDIRAPSARSTLSLSLRREGGNGAGLEGVGVNLRSGSGSNCAGGGLEIHSLAVRPTSSRAGHSAGYGPREIAVGCSDGSIAVVDLSAGKILAASRVHSGAVRSLDSLGPFLASAGDDGCVAICGVTVTEMAVVAGGGEGIGGYTTGRSPAAAAGGGGGGAGLSVLSLRKDHTDKTLCARWHPSAPALISTSADKTALLYTW